MAGLIGIVIALMLFTFSLSIRIISVPFNYINNLAYKYPLKVSRSVIGFIASTLIAYIFELPFSISLSFTFGSGIASFILGELL